MFNELVNKVAAANPSRNADNLYRRLLKVIEEMGETSEAYLSVTSPANYKNKSWLDYREEAVDTLIVLIDISLTQLTNFPPAALIPFNIRLATEHSFDNPAKLEVCKFEVIRAVGAAEQHLRDNKPIAFYGALSRAIQAAADMCFARIPNDHDPKVISSRITELFDKKLQKWISNQNIASTQEPEYERS